MPQKGVLNYTDGFKKFSTGVDGDVWFIISYDELGVELQRFEFNRLTGLMTINGNSITPVADDLIISCPADIAADIREIVLPSLLNKRYRILRNNIPISAWNYKISGLDKTGFILNPPEEATGNPETFTIQFY